MLELELSHRGGRTSVKVHPRREGGWAPQLARELAERQPTQEPTLVDRHAERAEDPRSAHSM